MSAVVRYNPNRSLLGPNLFDQFFGSGFNRAFDEAFGVRRPEGDEDLAAATWVPAADVRETEDAVHVDLEIPGVSKDDIDVSLEDGILKVTGERSFKRDVGKENYQRVERFYGKFSRAFRMPRHVDAGKVKASFKDGVLSLELPKSEEARPKQIAIH